MRPFTREYLLPRDSLESQRLNDQHDLLAYTLGYTVHPSIRNHLASIGTPKIADIGCGTGVFLAALAKETPQATLIGYDISPDQFPINIPPNIRLQVHNLSHRFSVDEQGTFDFVHLRLVGQGLRPDQRKMAISHATSLLRPGGYLQWIEPDHIYHSSIVYPSSSLGTRRGIDAESETPIIQRLLDFSRFHASDLHWDRESMFACALRALVDEDGSMEAIREEVVPIDWSDESRARAIRIDNSLSIFRAAIIEGLDRGWEDQDLGLHSTDDLDRVLALARKEMDEGDLRYRYWLHSVVGRKV